MKRFFLMALLAAVFFTGLGSILSETMAKFKSDERALALLQKARQAIGGESNLANVNSLILAGKSTRTFKIDGADRTETGDLEIALQLPDKMVKMINMRHDGANGEKTINKQVDVFVMHGDDGNLKWKTEGGDDAKIRHGQKIVIKKDDGAVQEVQTGSGERIIVQKDRKPGEAPAGDDKHVRFEKEMKGGEGEFPWQLSQVLRTSLALFLSAPQGMDVNYLYGGEGTVDGTACNIIDAQFGKSSIRLFLGKDSNLPVMMSYQDAKPMIFAFKTKDGEIPEVDKNVQVFARNAGPAEMAEYQVRFSDYRSVNGVLLPHKWTQTIGGQPDEIIDVISYEINPANIADRFKASPGDHHKTFVRKAKEQ